jgi:hypothetical protein
MSYVATINVPGYLPMDDEPPTFDTAWEAWQYLADERQHAEDNTEGAEFTETIRHLRERMHEARDTDWDGIGTVYGATPGYDGEHDLGLAYCVSLIEHEEDDVEEENFGESCLTVHERN